MKHLYWEIESDFLQRWLSARSYFNRYTDDATGHALSSFSSQSKATLHELCRVMGLPGKPDTIDGSEAHKYLREGRIQEIADYCETDIVNTYGVWLRYELFRGRLSDRGFHASEGNLAELIKDKTNDAASLADLLKAKS